MTNGNAAEPKMLSATEGLDEDELAADPLEDGVEPPENWSAAERFGTTPEEVREGESLEQKLAEERPDVDPGEVPERPIAITPRRARRLDRRRGGSGCRAGRARRTDATVATRIRSGTTNTSEGKADTCSR